MAVALASRPEIAVHVVHDERAAAFVALGLGLDGVPAALLCTSGTAAANLHPAVVEAGPLRRERASAWPSSTASWVITVVPSTSTANPVVRFFA